MFIPFYVSYSLKPFFQLKVFQQDPLLSARVFA
jgi:hypothetical protein